MKFQAVVTMNAGRKARANSTNPRTPEVVLALWEIRPPIPRPDAGPKQPKPAQPRNTRSTSIPEILNLLSTSSKHEDGSPKASLHECTRMTLTPETTLTKPQKALRER